MTRGESVAIVAGDGVLPPLVAAAAARQGRRPVVFAIAGEADAGYCGEYPVHVLHWGEVGRFFRLAAEARCREVVFIGGVARRPDYTSIRLDFGAVRLVPRILRMMRAGDDGVLRGAAQILEEHGLKLISTLDLAPELALRPGVMAGEARPNLSSDLETACRAAQLIGELDIGQGAVAVNGRVVAVEDAGGTDALLERIIVLRRANRIPRAGGVLVKCMKPNQDSRFDLPTLGPKTAVKALAAGLDGVAAEAGRTLLAGPAETVEAFRRAGLFLLGIEPPPVDG